MCKKYISPWVFMTHRCNLACDYCYIRQTNKKEMDTTTLRKINDKLYSFDGTIVYRIAGGEPLLNFDVWKDEVARFKNSRKNIFISVLTNLTILTDEMIEWFVENEVGFGISLDGMSYSKPYHNGNSSHNIVISNLEKLLRYIPGNRIAISTVIKDPTDLVALSQFIGKYKMSWGVYLDHFLSNVPNIIDQIDNVLDTLVGLDYDLKDFKFNNISLDSSYDGCSAGDRLFAIDYDGSIYPCQTTIYGDPMTNILKSNDIYTDMKNSKQHKIGHNYILPTECESCSIKDMCGGGCKVHNKEINKNGSCDLLVKVIKKMLIKTIENYKQ